jgi:glycolate oxidase FAD binding subunit
MELGRPPTRVDVVIDTARLNRILSYSPADQTVEVQAGVTLAVLAAHVARHGQMLALDPAGAGPRSLGGLVATAASGPLRARYGTLRDLLLGVRFVQATGVITWGGARVVKSVTGYDVPKLMVGALGTVGILAELTLRLHPIPADEATTIGAFAEAPAAAAFVAALLDSTVQASKVELLSPATAAGCGAGEGWCVAVAVGSVTEAVLAQIAIVDRLVGESGGAVRRVPDVWSVYDRVMTASDLRLRIGTLTDDVARAAAEAVALLGPRTAIGACAPAGVVDVVARRIPPEAAEAAILRLRQSVATRGGSVVVQAAPRALRERVDPWGPIDPDAFALMAAIKHEFDPAMVLNCGRFVGGL